MSKSLETWIWDVACSIHGEQDAPRCNDFTLPLILSTPCTRHTLLCRLIVLASGGDTRVSYLKATRWTAAAPTSWCAAELFVTGKMGSVNGRQYTAQFKGASWDKERGRWKALINTEGRRSTIGRFSMTGSKPCKSMTGKRLDIWEHGLLNFPEEAKVMNPTPAPLTLAA